MNCASQAVGQSGWVIYTPLKIPSWKELTAPLESRGGSIIIGIFVAVAATLLFIPEITRLTRGDLPPPAVVSSSEDNDAEEQDEKSEKGKELPEEDPNQQPTEDAEFNRALKQIESGEVDLSNLELGKDGEKAAPGDTKTGSTDNNSKGTSTAAAADGDASKLGDLAAGRDVSLEQLSEPPIPPERKAEREELKRLVTEPSASWELLKDPKVRKPIDAALREASVLLKVVGKEFPRSRFALLNYVNALDIGSRRAKAEMDFKEWLQFIGVLDVRVTQSFIEERVGRTEYLIWRAISLGAFVEVAGGSNEFIYNAPLRTSIVLTKLDLRVSQNAQKGREFHIRVTGVVEGKDVNRMEVYQGKRLLQIIDLPPPRSKDNKPVYRRFTFTQVDSLGNRPYTLRVLDAQGNLYQKSYSLVALPMRKFKANSSGQYQIPGVDAHRLTEAPIKTLDDMLMLGVRSNMTDRRVGSSGDQVLSYSSFDQRIERLQGF